MYGETISSAKFFYWNSAKNIIILADCIIMCAVCIIVCACVCCYILSCHFYHRTGWSTLLLQFVVKNLIQLFVTYFFLLHTVVSRCVMYRTAFPPCRHMNFSLHISLAPPFLSILFLLVESLRLIHVKMAATWHWSSPGEGSTDP